MRGALPDYQSFESVDSKGDQKELDILRAPGFNPNEIICLLSIHYGVSKKELHNLLGSSQRHARRIYRDTERKVSARTYASAAPPLNSDKNCPKRTPRSVSDLQGRQKLSQTDIYVRSLELFQYLSEKFLAENTRQYYRKPKNSVKEKKKSSSSAYVSSSSNVLSFKNKNNVLVQQELISEGKVKQQNLINEKDIVFDKKKDPYEDYYEKIIDDLNKKSGKDYKSTTEATREIIRARLKEKFILEDFFKVHTNMVALWKHDKTMFRYIRPETLYGKKKFEGYINSTPTQSIKTGMAETRADAAGKVPSKDNPLISDRIRKLKEKYE